MPSCTVIRSEQYRPALFGLGHDFTTHTAIIEAAQLFYAIRKETEKQRTRLASLKVSDFNRAHSSFKKNLDKFLTDTSYQQLLRPLLGNGGHLNFILACFVLSPNHVKGLQTHNMVDIFPKLFKDTAGSFHPISDTLSAINRVIEDACATIESTSSEELRGLILRAPSLTNMDATERATKRARLDSEDIDPLILGPELLEEDYENINPPNLSQRDVVMQFSSADTKHLEKLFENSPILIAIKASHQWRWERANDLDKNSQTDCMVALIPRSEEQDFSFVLRVGYKAGKRIHDYLQYGASNNPALVSM
ncbi:hypothetical protein BGZ63DRAFT_96145 [Mariannaea sp. PMI_226]|nr:hypothetical protein BGZ63DRAFT_96145 [Mariannaea sp. PMI_226]